MAQILNAPPPKRPSFGQQIAKGLMGGAAGALDQYNQRQLATQQMQQENAAIKQLLGFDASGITDPKMRAKLVESGMKAQNDMQQQKQKQEYLSSIFGGSKGQGQGNVGNQLMSGGEQEQNAQQDQGQQGYNPIDISDEDIARATSMDPTLGRELRSAKDSARAEKRHADDLKLKQLKASPEYLRDKEISQSQATSDVKYNESLQETSKQHELKVQTLNRLEKLNKKGVTGKPYEKILEKSGLINLTSEGRREFAADVKNLITDIRSILGGQFSNFEFQTILNAYPSPDFSKEANESIIKNLKNFQDIKVKEAEFASDLKKQNGGKLPVDFQSKVNERVKDYAATKMEDIKRNTQEIMNNQYGIPKGFTLLLDPNGDPLSVPDEEVEFAVQNGAERP